MSYTVLNGFECWRHCNLGVTVINWDTVYCMLVLSLNCRDSPYCVSRRDRNCSCTKVIQNGTMLT